MRCIAWWHFQWPWQIPNSVFKIIAFFEVEYRKNGATKLLLHKKKLYLTWNDTMFGDLDWLLNASRGFISMSWASCSKLESKLARNALHRVIYGVSDPNPDQMPPPVKRRPGQMPPVICPPPPAIKSPLGQMPLPTNAPFSLLNDVIVHLYY